MDKDIPEFDYKTGHEAIDNQHSRFIELFNKLYHSINNNEPSENISGYLTALNNYASFHFQLEETKLTNLPGQVFGEHKKEHEQFKKIASHIEAEIFTKGNYHTLYELVLYLKEWIEEHIQFSDVYHLKNATA